MTLFYQLTEEEFRELDIVRGQVALMSDVMGQCGKGIVNVKDVGLFLDNVHEKVCAVTEVVEKRDVCRKGVQPEMLTLVLRMAAGEDLDAECMQEVSDQLLTAMQDEPAFAAALRPFYVVLTQRGYKLGQVSAKPVQPRPRRRREKLIAEGTEA